MADRVEETIVTLRQFVADAAHELHTPLTALQTDLDLVAQLNQDEANATRLARAQKQAKRLQALTDNLLDLSRLEADKTLALEPLLLNDLLLAVSEMFASRAEQAEIEYTVLVPDVEVRMLGDVGRLQQAISNLLDNALKFTPANGSVSLTLASENDEAVVTITDTGIGIPAEDIPFLFGRFHRGRNTQAYPGNGLGLAIVKAIVEGHHGRVRVSSSPLQTQFVLTFPLL
jgi:two-component system OmpR family sensor kinase